MHVDVTNGRRVIVTPEKTLLKSGERITTWEISFQDAYISDITRGKVSGRLDHRGFRLLYADGILFGKSASVLPQHAGDAADLVRRYLNEYAAQTAEEVLDAPETSSNGRLTVREYLRLIRSHSNLEFTIQVACSASGPLIFGPVDSPHIAPLYPTLRAQIERTTRPRAQSKQGPFLALHVHVEAPTARERLADAVWFESLCAEETSP